MKKLLLNLEKRKLLFAFTLFSLMSYSQVTIKSQGFENAASDNLSYTTGTYVGVSNTTAMSGANSLRFSAAAGNSNISSNTLFENIDISGYSNVQVSIAFAATAVDDNEDLFIDFSYNNGSTYTTTVKLVDGNSGSGGQNINFGSGDSSPGQSTNPYVFDVPSTSTSLRIRVRSTSLDSGEFLYIDNIVIRGVGSPEINLQANGNNIPTGSTTISGTINTDFGNTDVTSGSVTRTYTVQNTGTSSLSVWSVYTNSGDFSTSISSSTIAAGGTATLTVVFNPTNAGTRTGIVSISNNDSNESTYSFTVEGNGTEQEINLQGGSPLTNIASGSTLISNSINTDFGTTSGTRTFTVQNLGTSNLSISSAWSSLTDYTISYGASTIAPGASTTLTVTFNPTASGTRTATISISNNDSNEGTYTFNVSGVIADKEINLIGNTNNIVSGSTTISTTLNTDFGNVQLGSGNVSKTYTIENTGGITLNIWSTYTNMSDFTVSSSSSTIAAGATATLTVVYNPSTLGTRTATVSIGNDDNNEGTYIFRVEAVCVDREINITGNSNNIIDGSTTISTTTHTDFGTLDISTGTATRTYIIQNTGTAVLTISNPTVSGTNAADFSISTNPATLSIAAGASTTFVVTFNPSASGARNATVNIVNNDRNENPYNFSIQGNGVNPEINLQGNSNNITDGSASISLTNHTDFGSLDIASATITRTYTIQNTGTTVLTISNPTISGTNAADFAITTNPATLSIAAGASTTFVVTFNPSAIGTRNATINIVNNDANESTYDFAIQGTGTNSEINLQGNSNNIIDGSTSISTTIHTDFGSINVTAGTATRTYTIQNTGTSALIISNPTISGTNAGDFTVTTNPATLSIATGASTTFIVTFNPSASGTRNAIVNIVNNDSNENPYDFAIQGTGTEQEINVQGNATNIADGSVTITSTNHTDYGSIDTSLGSISRTYTIQNLGTSTLTISNPTLSGINAADFAVTTNPATLSIAAGASTTFVVTFDPIGYSARTATINIVNNDSDENPYNFDIQGTGILDIDGDGLDSSVDIDDDNDGITDIIECNTCLSDPFENGSFENPVIAASSYAILPTGNVTGWQTSAENFIEIWSSGFNGVPSANGNQFAELNANVPGILYQSFCLNGAGGTINWSIKHRGRDGVDQAFVKFGSTLAGAIASTPIVEMIDGNTAWGTYSGTYNIPIGQSQIFLTFQAGYTGSGSQSVGNFIDDVQITINQNCVDTDNDGIANINDLDSDNDGIPDIEEAGFKAYSNNTATMDKSSSATWIDANGNGMNDYIDAIISTNSYFIANFDGDSMRNHLDLDSDNDSIFDVDEAGLLNGDGDINGDGKGDGLDSDTDGILNLFDNLSGWGTTARAYAVDTDSNGISDYLQLDSNSDGIYDIHTGLYGSYDANNDGIIDGSGDGDRDGITDTFDTNPNSKGSPRDLNRKLLLDFDGRNDYAQSSAVLGGLANASLMAWVDLNSAFNSEGVIVGQDKFQIRVTSDKKLEAVVNNTTVKYNTVALNTAQWYHVGAVYTGSVLKLYLNGTMVASTSASGNINADASLLTLGKNPVSNTKYFKGKIDEVRVFNVALTDTQLQRMVYQEIQNTGSQVRGTIIPKDISSLPFANLLRYYRMDTYKDDIVDDLTTTSVDTGTGMKMYNHKNIYVQQAPMPFITKTTGTFATAVNDTSNDIRGLDVLDYDYSIIQVQHNIAETANNTSIGMFIDPGVTVTMSNDTKLQNDWYLKLDGKIDLSGKSQLVQTNNSDLEVTSSGSIERDQQGQSNIYNYNYWSSPVSSMNNTTINHGYTIAGVMKDGTTSTPQNLNWSSGLNGAATSPITIASYWIFKFQNLSSAYANWSAVGPNGSLLAGQGYTMKGSNAASANQNYTFVGKPNNGTITSTVSAGNLNLCGNPFASAIDANQFIDDNIASITGTLFFWEHYSTNNSHNTIDYQGGYATYTKVGGTAPVAPAGISGLGSSAKVAKRFIPVGQGFFVTGSATGGTLTFNNNQRIFVKEDNSDSFTLYRNNTNATVNADPNYNNSEDSFGVEEFMKLRLGYTSANNYHREILLGFMNENATAGFDNGYDALSIETLTNDMYFTNGDKKLNIQGDGFFNANNIYPLGVKNATEGIVKFGINKKESFEESQDIFIYDNVTETYHDIKSQTFEINLAAGTFEDRFSLRFFNPSALGTNENELQHGVGVNHSQTDNMININNELQEVSIKSVALFNLLGQQVVTWKIDSQNQTEMHLPVSGVSTGGYIVKIITDKGDITKKILIK
ncbi:choice-of-anchor D domain-containing protein [Flavobacterium sp. UBA7682]|uniref:choice-of-anchor D domain-containing protein n=1 Tax=Flavobacterium sp. UBA7682 TaxID=1946560 RepID=UPI0025BA4CD8|nr:choice-of-anchor D domain-containing protein [Flavobacterium sp. UBA7682]